MKTQVFPRSPVPQHGEVHNALLAYVPEPLALRRGPVLVHIERYADEYDNPYFVAKLPAVLSEGMTGASETEALEALGVAILSFYEDVDRLTKADNLCGSLLQNWRAFEELFEVKT